MKSEAEINKAINELVSKLDYYDELMCAEPDQTVFKRLYKETKEQIHLLRWVLND